MSVKTQKFTCKAQWGVGLAKVKVRLTLREEVGSALEARPLTSYHYTSHSHTYNLPTTQHHTDDDIRYDNRPS